MIPSLIIHGFMGTGIYPYNPEAVLHKVTAVDPSTTAGSASNSTTTSSSDPTTALHSCDSETATHFSTRGLPFLLWSAKSSVFCWKGGVVSNTVWRGPRFVWPKVCVLVRTAPSWNSSNRSLPLVTCCEHRWISFPNWFFFSLYTLWICAANFSCRLQWLVVYLQQWYSSCRLKWCLSTFSTAFSPTSDTVS